MLSPHFNEASDQSIEFKESKESTIMENYVILRLAKFLYSFSLINQADRSNHMMLIL